MDNKLLNKVITISGEETKRTQYGLNKKIKDEKGLTYNIYDTTAKGTPSVAWEQYTELQIGDTVQIGYIEEVKEYQGKGYTARTIRNFNKDIGEGAARYQNSQPQETPRSGQNVASGRDSEWVGRVVKAADEVHRAENPDWDQIAVGKCQTAFLAAYLQAGNTFADAKLRVVSARKLAELVVFGTQQEELPTINQDDDPAGDFNPMVNDKLPQLGAEFGEDIPF